MNTYVNLFNELTNYDMDKFKPILKENYLKFKFIYRVLEDIPLRKNETVEYDEKGSTDNMLSVILKLEDLKRRNKIFDSLNYWVDTCNDEIYSGWFIIMAEKVKEKYIKVEIHNKEGLTKESDLYDVIEKGVV